VHEAEPGQFQRQWQSLKLADLPAGEVLIRVHFSALNYKDALSATGNKGVTRQYPHTPGIDAAGVVAESEHPDWQAGDQVIVTSYDLGMNTDGGFAEYIRVPASWVVRLPAGMSLRESMIMGTAGFTAALGLAKMERIGQTPAMGPLVVTGASGGVGSMAVGILAQAGYEVIAITGKADAHDYLLSLGASRVEGRDYVDDQSGRPLLKPQWAGAIDTVGGNTLLTLLKACSREGSVACCGLVGSPQLGATVFPFILNGVNLIGIDSATIGMDVRQAVWAKLAAAWRVPDLDRLATDCTAAEIDGYIEAMLQGQTKGRVILGLGEARG
jgi:putative YhdH/YhfP family quinone oxidoreductase